MKVLDLFLSPFVDWRVKFGKVFLATRLQSIRGVSFYAIVLYYLGGVPSDFAWVTKYLLCVICLCIKRDHEAFLAQIVGRIFVVDMIVHANVWILAVDHEFEF